jgi:hypothetical protein
MDNFIIFFAFLTFLLGVIWGHDAGWRYGRRALVREVQGGGDMEEIIDRERRSA